MLLHLAQDDPQQHEPDAGAEKQPVLADIVPRERLDDVEHAPADRIAADECAARRQRPGPAHGGPQQHHAAEDDGPGPEIKEACDAVQKDAFEEGAQAEPEEEGRLAYFSRAHGITTARNVTRSVTYRRRGPCFAPCSFGIGCG